MTCLIHTFFIWLMETQRKLKFSTQSHLTFWLNIVLKCNCRHEYDDHNTLDAQQPLEVESVSVMTVLC